MDSSTIAPGEFVVTLSEFSGEAADYEVLPAEEPIKVNIVDISKVPGMYPDPETGETKTQLKFALKVAAGQKGEGQVYSLWVNAPVSNTFSPKSGLYQKIVSKVFPNGLDEKFDISDLLGKPLRIELTAGEPSKKDPSKTYQKIAVTKSPTKDQKAVEVEKKDFNPISAQEIEELFGGDSDE